MNIGFFLKKNPLVQSIAYLPVVATDKSDYCSIKPQRKTAKGFSVTILPVLDIGR